MTIGNTNSQSDVIDLGGRVFKLSSINNDFFGNTGLPVVLPDNSSTLTIQNGEIIRDMLVPNLQIRHLVVGSRIVDVGKCHF